VAEAPVRFAASNGSNPSGRSRQPAGREASDARVQLPREADQAGQHESLVSGAWACRHRGFPLHDLRHCWASWHVQNGTPLFALQELAVGRVRRWCGATRTSPLATWHPTRNAFAQRVPSPWKATAQLRHRG